MASPSIESRDSTRKSCLKRWRAKTLLAAMVLAFVACGESSTAPVDGALVVHVVEDTISAQLFEDGTWTSTDLTIELRNQSPTDTLFSGGCGTVRLVDESTSRQFAFYCPTTLASAALTIPPGGTVTIDWEEFGCPHTDCGFDGNVGRVRVRVGYNVERWVSAEYRLGRFGALSESFVIVLD